MNNQQSFRFTCNFFFKSIQSIVNVFLSISTKIGLQFKFFIGPMLAWKLLDVVKISSSFVKLRAYIAASIEDVPLQNVIPKSFPINLANFSWPCNLRHNETDKPRTRSPSTEMAAGTQIYRTGTQAHKQKSRRLALRRGDG